MVRKVANKLRASGQIQDKDRYIPISEAKEQMVAMLKDLKADIDIMSDTVVEDRTVTITSWSGMQKRICKLIQSKIDKLKENNDETDKSNK